MSLKSDWSLLTLFISHFVCVKNSSVYLFLAVDDYAISDYIK